MLQFLWFEVLDSLWKDNPAFTPITTSSAPGVDHAGSLAALIKGKRKRKHTAPPPLDLLDTDGDFAETPGMLDDIFDPDPVVQGKSKGKAIPLPDPVTNEPMDIVDADLEHAHTSDVPPIEPSAPGHLGSHALAEEDAIDDDLPWEVPGMLQDEVLEQDNREDEPITPQPLHQSNKRPYPFPSPPSTHASDTTKFPSGGKFQTHADRAVNRGSMRSPKTPSSVVSSLASSSRHTHTMSSTLSPSASSSSHKPSTTHKPTQKSNLSKCADAELEGIERKLQSLTEGMSYIYTAKAASLEYKIAKVNIHRHQCDIEFQREQAEKARSEAAIIHQRAQEAKSLDLQVLEAQAKVQAEKKATLQLEIKLQKLRGRSGSST